jgi:hypothetical protein
MRHAGDVFTPVEDDVLGRFVTAEAGAKIGIVHGNIGDRMPLFLKD